MKISSHIRSHRTQADYRGFTLIELLVVISIIAVLAGLLFPAMGAVRNMARKTSAKNDVTQIVNAVKMYYTEYGRYPLVTADPSGTATSTQQFTSESQNGQLIGVLRASGGANTDNPRGIRFLEVPNAKSGRSGLVVGTGASATPNADAAWMDPWKRPYQIFISKSYKGQIIVPGVPTSATATTSHTLNTEVAAFSKGKDDARVQGDPVLSWQ